MQGERDDREQRNVECIYVVVLYVYVHEIITRYALLGGGYRIVQLVHESLVRRIHASVRPQCVHGYVILCAPTISLVF